MSLHGATLIPAYGRDYKNKADAIASFLGGKDWQIASLFHGNGYCSVSDCQGGERISLRYARQSKVAVVSVPAKGGAL